MFKLIKAIPILYTLPSNFLGASFFLPWAYKILAASTHVILMAAVDS